MNRINVYAYPEYESPQIVGWFDASRADCYESETGWNGQNRTCRATGSATEWQRLYRTTGGRWVLYGWSRWEGVQDTARFISDDEARDWLIRATDITPEQIGQLVGRDVPDEQPTKWGRPSTGTRVGVRIPDEVLGSIDARAESAGQTRAEWIRDALTAAVQG